jgi:hypothetical protein
VAPLVQHAEQLMHGLEEWHERLVLRDRPFIAIGQDGVDVRVGHPRIAVDHAVVEFVADDLPLAVHFHQARLHEAIHLGVEAADAGREFRREHVHRPLREIHGRPPIVGLFVEYAAFFHIVCNVGDVHARARSGRSAAARA